VQAGARTAGCSLQHWRVTSRSYAWHGRCSTGDVPCVNCQGELEADALYCGFCGHRTRTRSAATVGTVIDDKYRIDEKLAEGGFGAIYRATHLASGAAVALKILHADFATEPSLAARFLRESEALLRLRSPHTVITYERGESRDGTLYIAMELLHGESLLERFRRLGPLPWREVLAIMRAVCNSLHEAHARGIVHRDLKPANIHLGGGVKVLDFGVAKMLPWSGIDDGADLTLTGQTVGTLEYMAPEQLASATCDARTDIYALGVVAYEMITGRRPFPDAHDPPSMITALFTQSVPPPSHFRQVPPHVDQMLVRCLQRDPSERYTTAYELALALDRAVTGRNPPRDELAVSASSGAGPRVTHPPARHVMPPIAYALPLPERPSRMPAFDIEVRGTVIDAWAHPQRRRTFWWLALGVVIVWTVVAALVISGA
jgi:serine/threonine protein kinase